MVPSVQALLQRLHGFEEEGKIPLEREGQLAQLLKQIEMSLVPFCGQEPKDPSRLEVWMVRMGFWVVWWEGVGCGVEVTSWTKVVLL